MKSIAIVLVSIMICSNIYGQTIIKGKVYNKKSESIVGANIYIKNTYDGVTSDVNGVFEFSTDLMGKQVLVVSFIGYKLYEKEMILDEKEINLTIELNEETSELDAVVISAGAFEASDEKKAVVLRPLDIVTTAGGLADIYGVMNTLPGTQTVGEEGELFVRGGDKYETKTFIDGLLVQSPYYSSMPDVPTRGRFSPFLFSGTIFSTGGYSAEYGQALSSALILKTNDLPESTVSSISLMGIGFGASHMQKWKKSSLSFEGAFTDLTPYFNLIDQDFDWDKGPNGFDGAMNYRQKTGKNGMLKCYSSYSYGGSELRYPNFDLTGTKTRIKLYSDNLYFNSSYTDIINPKWHIRTGFSYSDDQDKNDLNMDNVKINVNSLEGKLVLTHFISDYVNIKFGGNLIDKQYDQQYFEAISQITYASDYSEKLFGSFVESEIRINSKFGSRIGIRQEYSGLLKETSIVPRISLAYKTGKHSQVSTAYGIFYQNPEDTYLQFNQNLDFQKANHYIINYQIIKNKQTFRIEAYYKEYNKLVKYDSLYSVNPASYNNNGQGYAKGIDVFWRNTSIKMLDYWISYSYIDTKRDYRDFIETATPTYVSNHNLSVVTKYFIPKITTQVGLTYSFASGRPYFNPNNSEFLEDKTKAYNDLSFNLSKLAWIKGNFTVVYVSISNILGFDNIFGYHYSNQQSLDGKYRAFAIKPGAKRFYFIGMFISFEYDKKKE